jgi:hypothetical protein
VTGDQPHLWLELAEFETVLPAEVRSDNLRVRHAAVHPTEPDWLFLLLPERSAYLVSYPHSTGEIDFHISSQADEIEGDFLFHLSPDGRWLTILSGVIPAHPLWYARRVHFVDLYNQAPLRSLEGFAPPRNFRGSGHLGRTASD